MLWRATLSFGLGLVLADAAVGSFAGTAGVAVASLVGWISIRKRRPLADAVLCLAYLSIGAMALHGALESARRAPVGEPRSFVVEATVCGVGGRLARPELELCRAVDAFEPDAPMPERLLLQTSGDPGDLRAFDSLVVGHRIRAQVRWLALRPATNPGSRDGARSLQRRGIGARAVLRDPALLVRLSSQDDFILPGRAALAKAFRTQRREVAERLAREGAGGALLRALALGDRGALAAEHRARFAALGIAHLLAVSGLHVVLVAGAAFALGRACFRRWGGLTRRGDARRAALGFAFVCALVFGIVAGWGIPVRRALLFFSVIAASVSMRRPVRTIQTLGVAAFVLLALEPHALFELSAQLSFAATAALLLARPRDAPQPVGFRERIVDGLLGLLHTSATAIAATAPLLAWHGLQTGAAGLLANLIAVPWTTFVLLPASVAAAAVAAMGDGEIAGRLLGLLGETGRVSLEAVAFASHAVPGRAGAVAPGGFATTLSLLAIFATLRSRTLVRRLVGCVIALGALQFGAPPAIDPPPPRAVFLDVGQGDATVLQGRDVAMLIDGGRAIPGRFDQGERVVLPALRALGVDRLDVVVATHADIDHRGGLAAVLRSVPVDALWLPFLHEVDPGFAELIALAGELGVRVVRVSASDSVRRVGDLRVEVLWPSLEASGGSRNDDSIVLRASFGAEHPARGHVLLAADIGEVAERILLDRGAALRGEVLKVGHHGSNGSSSPPWLRHVAADHAIVSAPCHGRAGLPAEPTVERLIDHGFELHWTGEVGAVIVGFSQRGGSSKVRHWVDALPCSISHRAQ